MEQIDIFGPDPKLARLLATQGATRAAEKADRVTPQWSKTALAFVRSYAMVHERFMTEDVRVAAEQEGIARAPDARAWGSVMLVAAREGIIRASGYAKQRAANCHGSPKTVWRAV